MVALPHVAAASGAAGFYALLQIGIVRFVRIPPFKLGAIDSLLALPGLRRKACGIHRAANHKRSDNRPSNRILRVFTEPPQKRKSRPRRPRHDFKGVANGRSGYCPDKQTTNATPCSAF